MTNVFPHPEHSVLVVEDNEHSARMLEFILKRSGYQVQVLLDGREALDLVTSSEPVDAVVLDLMLPYVSGEELISAIRDSDTWRYVPIVVVSGRVLEQDIVRAFELGVDDYLTKPFRPAELLVRLKRLLEARESIAVRRRDS